MDKFSRSKSSRESPSPANMNDLRSYSSSADYNNQSKMNVDDSFKEVKIRKNSRLSGSSKSLSFNLDPELKRKKRVAGYKAYGMEGKFKTSFRKSFRWVKDTCNNVIHGFW